MAPNLLLRAVTAALAIALAATACGGSDPVDDGRFVAAIEAAAGNEAQLALSADIASTEMLDVRTGEIRSLDDVVSGDRAVLLWYWAPD